MVAEQLLIALATLVSVGSAIPATVTPFADDAPFSIQPRDSGVTIQPIGDIELECNAQGNVIILSNWAVATFTTPDYPNSYPKNSNCSWEVKGQTPNSRIDIKCKPDFELEPEYSSHCYDYLDIDGSRYCGTPVTPLTEIFHESTTNTVKMSFVSDESKQYKGFNCTAMAWHFDDYDTSIGSPFTENPTTPTGSFTASCGRVNRATKIVGGVETEVHEYPWQVGLSWSQHSNGAFCGGSIINELWVLTAAHCSVRAGHYVVAGEHSWTTETETTATHRIVIEQVFRHPDFSLPKHDVALVKLASPLTFDPANNVAPVCPPSPDNSYDNVDAIVTGWGDLEQGGSGSTALQEVEVPTMNNSVCRSFYSDFRPITDDMICAGVSKGGKDSCQGDSGGPMVTADGGIYRQIGVVSWGKGCARPGRPGVYNRVSYELEWITTTIYGTSWDQPDNC